MRNDRRTLLIGAASALLVPAVARAAEGARVVLPRQAVHSDVIGPAAQIAMIRVYAPPEQANHTVSDWAGLVQALDRASPGDIILARAGHYGENRTLSVSNGGAAKIRLVSEAQGAARFSGRLTIVGSGLSLEGWNLEKLKLESTSDIDVKHGRMTEFRLAGARTTLFEDFVCDGNYDTGNKILDSSENGRGTPTSGITMRRGIVCRGSKSNADLIQTSASNDFDMEQVCFFDQRQPSESDFHSDVFQSFFPDETGPQRWRFRRCHFYTFDRRDIRPNQGLFLSDGHYGGVDIDECLFGANNGASIMGPSVQNAEGTFRNCTSFSALRGMGDSSELVIRENFATHLVDSNYAPASGKNVITRPESFYVKPSHGYNRGYDWRDFVPVRDHGVGARDFLAELRRVWG